MQDRYQEIAERFAYTVAEIGATTPMDERERRAAYAVCKQRGHTPSNVTLTVNPPLSVCAFCGTQYRYEQQLIEQNVPAESGAVEPS